MISCWFIYFFPVSMAWRHMAFFGYILREDLIASWMLEDKIIVFICNFNLSKTGFNHNWFIGVAKWNRIIVTILFDMIVIRNLWYILIVNRWKRCWRQSFHLRFIISFKGFFFNEIKLLWVLFIRFINQSEQFFIKSFKVRVYFKLRNNTGLNKLDVSLNRGLLFIIFNLR